MAYVAFEPPLLARYSVWGILTAMRIVIFDIANGSCAIAVDANRKHAQAAYVPSLFRTPPPHYRYGPRIHLCEKTDLTLFLQAVASGTIYYDPAIKLEGMGGAKPALKRRSQFRVRHDQLGQMYHQSETVELDIVLTIFDCSVLFR